MSKEMDNKIELLKSKVDKKKLDLEDKKSKLGKSKTNFILHLEGETYNLNTLNKEQLLFLGNKVLSYDATFAHLEQNGWNVDYEFSGYHLRDWIDDIILKGLLIDIKDEEKQLKQMERTLESKLSEEYKINKELEEMEEFLK